MNDEEKVETKKQSGSCAMERGRIEEAKIVRNGLMWWHVCHWGQGDIWTQVSRIGVHDVKFPKNKYRTMFLKRERENKLPAICFLTFRSALFLSQ